MNFFIFKLLQEIKWGRTIMRNCLNCIITFLKVSNTLCLWILDARNPHIDLFQVFRPLGFFQVYSTCFFFLNKNSYGCVKFFTLKNKR